MNKQDGVYRRCGQHANMQKNHFNQHLSETLIFQLSVFVSYTHTISREYFPNDTNFTSGNIIFKSTHNCGEQHSI